MAHVVAYLIPVRRNLREAYTSVSARGAAVYREHGALRAVDSRMDGEPQRREVLHTDGLRGALAEASEATRDVRTAAGTGPNEVVVL